MLSWKMKGSFCGEGEKNVFIDLCVCSALCLKAVRVFCGCLTLSESHSDAPLKQFSAGNLEIWSHL